MGYKDPNDNSVTLYIIYDSPFGICRNKFDMCTNIENGHRPKLKVVFKDKVFGTEVPLLYERNYVTYRELLHHNETRKFKYNKKYLSLFIGFAVIYHDIIRDCLLEADVLKHAEKMENVSLLYSDFIGKYSINKTRILKSKIIKLCKEKRVY